MAAEATIRRPHPAVFLQDFVDVHRPMGAVARRLAADGGWLGPLAAAAGDDGHTLSARIGPSAPGEGLSREVVIRLGPALARGEAIVVPLRWEAVRHAGLFPVLDGDLELAPLGAEECRVVLHASYRPPLDGVGRWLDRAVLHRVAESTVRSFLQRMAGTIEDEVPPA